MVLNTESQGGTMQCIGFMKICTQEKLMTVLKTGRMIKANVDVAYYIALRADEIIVTADHDVQK